MAIHFCNTTTMYPVPHDANDLADEFECAECQGRVRIDEKAKKYSGKYYYCPCCGKKTESAKTYKLRKDFALTAWNCSFEEYRAFRCSDCDKEDCQHREAYRRVPKSDGGLALCPRLQEYYRNKGE